MTTTRYTTEVFPYFEKCLFIPTLTHTCMCCLEVDLEFALFHYTSVSATKFIQPNI